MRRPPSPATSLPAGATLPTTSFPRSRAHLARDRSCLSSGDLDGIWVSGVEVIGGFCDGGGLSMSRLVRGLVAILVAAPLVGVAALSAAPAASAEDNGVGQTPALGWSSWSFIRSNPTAAEIAAQADAMKSSGLARAGFQYVNLDDYWYECPGGQGPNVDQYGRWVI